MGIGKEFWDDKKVRLPDDKIDFIINNYKEIIKGFRAIKRQNEETYNKKVDAHNEILKLREVLDEINQKKKKAKKNEVSAIEQKIEELEKIREENDIIFLDGVPLRYNEVMGVINSNKYLITILDELDSKIKPKVASIAETALSYLLYPVSKIGEWIGSDSLKEISKDLPKDIGDSIRN